MKDLIKKILKEWEGRNIYNLDRKNRFTVERRSVGTLGGYGWEVKYSTKLGTGRALLFDNEQPFMLNNTKGDIPERRVSDMADDEMALWGIDTDPIGVGIGRDFLKDIFEYFNINRLYIYSDSKTHPVWTKIAKNTGLKSGMTYLFVLDRDQLLGGEVLKEQREEKEYERCSHFEANPQHRKLCYDLYTLGTFLYKDLGLKNIIDEKIKLMGEVKDLNDQYQEPLEILYNTGKFKEIRKEGDTYYLPRLSDRIVIYDENGEWSYVNKLNTNYADLAELLTELFIRGKVADKLSNKNNLGLKQYLNSIKDKLIDVLNKYFNLDEYRGFVRNTKELTKRGEQAEEDVKKVLEKFGMRTLYSGGHGDFIDMIFGVDLIMEYNGRTYLVQVKNTESQMLSSSKNPKYKKLDYFAAPTNFGVSIKNKNGNITKLNKEGQVIDDSQ